MRFNKKSVCKLKSLRHWTSLCVLLAVVLLLYHDPFLILWWPQKLAEKTETLSLRPLPLDMAEDSIDDMYNGCRSEAASMIDLFGVFEWHVNKNFSFAWAVAERYARKPAHMLLKEDHAIAVYLYTNLKLIGQDFIEAVKTGKGNYSTYGFKFHYLYFYLTEAIQVLRHNQTLCATTYHRTWKQMNQNVINTNMRFGTFILAALTKHSFAFDGNVSCFEIYTCFGADVTYYSATGQKGRIIPPYEVFKITDVLTNDPWCSVVYKLQSTKVPRTDLNCKLIQKQVNPNFGDIAKHLQTGRFGMMFTYLILMVIVSIVLVKRRQKHFVAGVLAALLVLTFIVMMIRINLWG